MNAFDYFFEKTKWLDKDFLVGRETISFKQLYTDALLLALAIERIYGNGNNIMVISANNLFFIKTYLAILKSGNICIPIDPSIEKENFAIVSNLTNPVSVFLTKDITSKLPVSSFACYLPDSMPDQHLEEPVFNSNSFEENRCAEIIFTSGSTGKP
jgi:long-chain acyl-CoA synthetase